MIYELPKPDDALDQGDLIEECPTVWIPDYQVGQSFEPKARADFERVVLLTH